jgi:transcriptional regulator GlxA family with amidase domain
MACPSARYPEPVQSITSAGAAAGIDACLYLVRKEQGSKVANAIARRMVVPPHRPVAGPATDSLAELLSWMERHLDLPVTIGTVAGRSGFGNATALRHHFRIWRSTTPQAYRRQFRDPAATSTS